MQLGFLIVTKEAQTATATMKPKRKQEKAVKVLKKSYNVTHKSRYPGFLCRQQLLYPREQWAFITFAI